MNYCYATADGWTGTLTHEEVTTETKKDYTKKPEFKYTQSLSRYLFDRRAMKRHLKYLDLSKEWIDILKTDAKNNYKAQFEVTFMLDDEFHKGNFKNVDISLDSFPIEAASPELLISILSSTIPAKDRLENRDKFYQQVSKTFTERGIMEPGLLTGLE